MITLYGSVRSSAARCFWCLEEIGVPYKAVPVDMKANEHKSENFLKINPNGKIPAMVDDQIQLFESMAINFYLAEKYKPSLLGTSLAEKALSYQWSFWATDFQTPVIEVYIQKAFVPADKKDQKIIDENMKKLPELFAVLEQTLQGRKFLSGINFTMADLHVASVVQITPAIEFDLAPYPNVATWMKAISERTAYLKVQALRK